MFKLFREGTKKIGRMGKFLPYKGDDKGEIQAVIMLVLAIMIGAILTGAIGPTSLASMVNATIAGTVGGAQLVGAPASVISTWNTIPVMYSIALFLVPIVLIARYIK